MGEPIEVWQASSVAYDVGLAWQAAAVRRALAGRAAGRREESLALIEHQRVVTLGRRGDQRSLLATPEELARRGIELVRSDRGGDVTYHGPGQLVAYPMLDLASRGVRVGDYVRTLEAAIVEVVSAVGLPARSVPGRPGVWVDDSRKLASIGVRVASGVSRHGLALNVTTDLADFDAIVPCGLEGTTMTSLDYELDGDAPAFEVVAARLASALADRLGFTLPAGPGVGVAA